MAFDSCNAVTPLSPSDIDIRTDCMVRLASDKKSDYKELITVVRAPNGVPLPVEGGGHICMPYRGDDLKDIQMRGALKLETLMSFCGLRIGGVIATDTQNAMQIFYQKMIDKNKEFGDIFQQVDGAKKMCP